MEVLNSTAVCNNTYSSIQTKILQVTVHTLSFTTTTQHYRSLQVSEVLDWMYRRKWRRKAFATCKKQITPLNR